MTAVFRTFGLAAGALSLGLALAAPVHAADTLRVGKAVASNNVFNLLDVGIKAGIFEKRGLNLEIIIFPGAAKVQQGLAADAADLAFSGSTDMALAVKGAPARAIAPLINAPDLVGVVAANSKFKSIEDLKGSVWMGSSKASISGWLPTQIPVKMGWPAGSMEFKTGAAPDSALALVKSGQFDATPTDQATAAIAEKAGDLRVIVKFADIVPGFYQYAIYATDKIRKEKPALVSSFLAGWLETLQYVKGHRDETIKVLASINNVDPAIVAKALDDALPKLVMDGKFTPASLDILKASFVDMGLVDKAPETAQIYDDSFLPKK